MDYPIGTLVLHSSVRLLPPQSPGDRWTAEHLGLKKRLRLSKYAMIVAAEFVVPGSRSEHLERIAARYALDSVALRSALQSLEAIGLIVEATQDETAALFTAWYSQGWGAAADHHVLTYDYSYLDYAVEGFRVDRDIMKKYHAAEDDRSRSKSYIGTDKLSVPRPQASMLQADCGDVLTMPQSTRPVTAKSIDNIFAMVFGKVLDMPLPYSNALPLMAKTSPSGGARHPTEGYVVVYNVPELEAGWYHYDCLSSSLELVRSGASIEEQFQCFADSQQRTLFPIDAVIVMTSQFDRNMYRYREPRTFRTIHIDAGHLVGTLELACGALGHAAFPNLGASFADIEEILQLDPLEEGVIVAVALGGLQAVEPRSVGRKS